MISGYLKIRAAGARLAGWSGDRETLAEAAEHLWSAGYHADSWPVYVKARYDRIRYRLFNGGTVRLTLAGLPDAEAADLAEELRRFSEAALSFRSSWTDL